MEPGGCCYTNYSVFTRISRFAMKIKNFFVAIAHWYHFVGIQMVTIGYSGTDEVKACFKSSLYMTSNKEIIS